MKPSERAKAALRGGSNQTLLGDVIAAIEAAEREAFEAGAAHCALAGLKGPEHFKTYEDWRQSRD